MKIRVSAFLVCFLWLPCHAQNPANGNSPASLPEYTFSVIRWSGSQTLWTSTFVERGKATETDLANLRAPEDAFESHLWVNREVFVHSRTRSPDFKIHSNGTVFFYNAPPRSLVERTDSGEVRIQTNIEPITTVNLASSDVEWLLLFFDDPGNPEAVQIISVADRTEQFPLGSVQFFNFSQHNPVFVIFGDQVRQIPRAGTVGFNPGSKTGEQIAVQFADPAVSTEKPIYSNMWYHEEDRRFMIFISERSRGRDGLDLKVLRR